MSITTYGWGSGNITTAGFGGYYEAVIDLIPRMIAEYLLEIREGVSTRDKGILYERAVEALVVRLKPALSQILSRSDDINNLLALARDKFTITTRGGGTVILREFGSIEVREKNLVGSRNKLSVISTRDRNSVLTREKN